VAVVTVVAAVDSLLVVAVALATVAAVEVVAVLLAADVVVPVAVPAVERTFNPKCSATVPTNMTQ
jgi:hypothetical protein